MDKKPIEFISLMKFRFNNTTFEAFHNSSNRLAFLKIDDNNKYHYPTLEEFSSLILLFKDKNRNVLELVNDSKVTKKKKKKFIPKVIIGTTVVALTYVSMHLIWVHGLRDFIKENVNQQVFYESVIENSTPTIVFDDNEEEIKIEEESENQIQEIIEDSITTLDEELKDQEIENKYLNLFATATDDLDYLWDNDYTYIKDAKMIKITDSKAYEEVFGFKKPVLEDFTLKLKLNGNIPSKYKDFYYELISDYLKKYPETDFSVLYQNIETLKIKECDKEEITEVTSSATALACYVPSQNTVYIREGANITDKNSEDFIIAAHELMHPARTTKTKKKENSVIVNFYDNDDLGYYLDETLNTYYAYELQGLDKKSQHYTIPSNYVRIYLDALGSSYTGADYMNHSVNYLAKQLDNYMGDEEYAYHVLAQLESLTTLYYKSYVEVDYNSFEDLNDYTLRVYMKKYLKEDMSYDETLELFNSFLEEITFNYENLSMDHIELTEDTFRETFENILKENNISKSYTR